MQLSAVHVSADAKFAGPVDNSGSEELSGQFRRQQVPRMRPVRQTLSLLPRHPPLLRWKTPVQNPSLQVPKTPHSTNQLLVSPLNTGSSLPLHTNIVSLRTVPIILTLLDS